MTEHGVQNKYASNAPAASYESFVNALNGLHNDIGLGEALREFVKRSATTARAAAPICTLGRPRRPARSRTFWSKRSAASPKPTERSPMRLSRRSRQLARPSTSWPTPSLSTRFTEPISTICAAKMRSARLAQRSPRVLSAPRRQRRLMLFATAPPGLFQPGSGLPDKRSPGAGPRRNVRSLSSSTVSRSNRPSASSR
jgi:hypothetical protein